MANLFFSPVIYSVENEFRVDSRELAKALGYTKIYEHKTLLKNIDKYLVDLEELGRVSFQNSPFDTEGGAQSQRIAYLNEQHCYFLLALARNTKHVVALKLSLIKSFKSLQQQIIHQAVQLAEQQIQIAQLKAEAAESRAAVLGYQLSEQAARVVEYSYAGYLLQQSNKQLEKSLATSDEYHKSALSNYSSLYELFKLQKSSYEKKIRGLESKVDALRTQNVYSSKPEIDNVIWLAKKHNFIK